MLYATGPEIWNVDAGKMVHKGKTAVVEDAFVDGKSPKGSGTNTPARSLNVTPAVSGAEDNASATTKKKKKLTRNQMKLQEERRRIRKLNWLTFGGERPLDTDSE